MSPSAAVLSLLLAFPQFNTSAQGNTPAHDRAARPAPAGKTSPETSSDPARDRSRLLIDDPYLRETARRVIAQAAEWLSFPQCQLLLSDFADGGGRHLTETLNAFGVSAGEYLKLIVFADGTARPGCRRHGILAFTSPGSRVIYLCGRDFVRAAQRTPEEAQAVLIHEMLHSLGLGENPPSSKEITHRVRQRCWR